MIDAACLRKAGRIRVLAFSLPLLLLLVTSAALATSSTIVISQVYGGGGNSGATLKNDFIELYNLGSSTVDVSGWSVQYAATTGTSWQKTNLSGSIAPGHYYLIKEAAGAGGTVDQYDVVVPLDLSEGRPQRARPQNVQSVSTPDLSCSVLQICDLAEQLMV